MLLRANIVTFLRERVTLFWTFAFPLLFIAIFGALFSGDSTPQFSVAVAGDQDSATGRAIVESLRQVSAFSVYNAGLDEGLDRLRAGKRDAVIAIPPRAGSGSAPAQVRVYYDATIASNQQILLPLLDQVISNANARLSASQPLIVPSPAPVQTHQLREIDFLLPGILSMALMQLGLFSSQAIVTQRETRVLRRLGATPLPRWILISSQVVARLITAVLQAIILIGVASGAFHFHIGGSFMQLAGFVALGALTFVAMGYAVAALAPTAEAAQPIAQVVSFPMLFLSGVFFPVTAIPSFLQPVVRALPLTYLSDALRQTASGGTPLNPLWLDTLVLCGWLLACLAFSVRFFRWE